MDNYRELKIRCDPGFGHLPIIHPTHPLKAYERGKLYANATSIISIFYNNHLVKFCFYKEFLS